MADRVEVNHRAIADLLRSPAIERDLRARADRIAAAAGPGFVAHSEVGQHRARAAVVTETFDAMLAEALEHRLLRAVDAGRG